MLHVRIVSPPALTPPLMDMLDDHAGLLNLIFLPGAARQPAGDVVQFDLATDGANRVMQELLDLGLPRFGTVAVESVNDSISDATIERPQHPARGRELEPVWAMVEDTIRQGAAYPPSYFVLLTIAALIAAVGILTNSEILIVGAMVIGPEYGSIVFASFCVTKREWRAFGRTMLVLILGFLAAIAVTLVFSVVIRNSAHVPTAYSLGIRPVSILIDNPNVFSVVVAVLAGIVGVVSITESTANAIVGVFISVTTIPAAAAVAVSIAFQSWNEARGAAFQLLLNVVVLVVIGTVAFGVQRWFWARQTMSGRVNT